MPDVRVPPGTPTLRLGLVGRPIPAGFLGLSMEFQALPAYAGTDPRAVDPVLVALIRALTPGQRPVLRIGGDSTDVSWVPAPGVRPPWFSGYTYPLTRRWLATAGALAHELDARMILGLDLAAGDPALDAAEARAFAAAFGRRSIAALEIGNEPNLYATIAEWTLADGRKVKARPRGYGPPRYRGEVAAVVRALAGVGGPWPLVGPALAANQNPAAAGVWKTSMAAFLRSEPDVRQLTVHRYPLKRCFVSRGSPQQPTIPHLLSEYSSAGLAAGVRVWVRIARAQGRTVRIDELGSVACRGQPGVSDTFASALWATDALFSLAAAGVQGVNLHTLPDAAYEPFTLSRVGGRWQAHVEPEYYGLRLFAQAAPAGSRLLAVRGVSRSVSLSAWATRARDGSERLVLIDKDPGRARIVRVAVPRGFAARDVRVERLTAPSVAARAGVRLGGRTFGAVTRTGRLGAPRTTRAPSGGGRSVVVRVAGASAALVTFRRG
ncbi:MAG TPA: glycosyl hydrolase family 79 C-terminal domain-containing protein [Solirubrobacteraceae bacterium]|nr:glycosyl hydrolase family 79 C-terminal domain-containing protein [Solirubrobacteraceae bacterium]